MGCKKMNKKIIFSIMVILLLSFTNVSAKWLCGMDGSTCRCTCVENPPCYGEFIPFNSCANNDWDDIQNGIDDDQEVEYVDPVLEINSPVDGGFYGNKRILIDIETDKKVDLYYSEDGKREARLAYDSDDYSKTKYFRDGEHTLKIIARDNRGNEVVKEITFTIDSNKPKISRTYPRRGTDVGAIGNFAVKFKEDNVDSVKLYYKGEDETAYNEVELSNCEEQRRYTFCEVGIDLTMYDEGIELDYYFVVSDKINQDVSRVTSVKVDPVVPVLTVNTPSNGDLIDGRTLLDVQVSEDVELTYQLIGEGCSKCAAKERTLCRRCNSYDRTRYFPGEGEAIIRIKATDDAGNVAIVEKTVILE